MNDRMEMMKQVQQLNFVLIDTGLFLNNQPDNPAALALFAKYQELYRMAKQEFEDMFGPISHAGVNSERDGWSWIGSPWPWEVEA